LVQLQVALARARAAITRQDWRRALQLLDEAGAGADRLHRGRDGLQVRMLRSLALKRCGEECDALFAEALSLARTFGLERILADTHPDLVAWAGRLGNEVHADVPPGRPVLAPAAAQTARVPPSALLTPKEREVLGLLSSGMSNKQIANALGVGDQTVKWHLKNLFGKLHAGTRKHALDRARMLGVLDADR
jgi:LuxR family maltose regulon positive regulatory protein